MATVDTTVNDLVINKLTQEQYDNLAEKSPTELYFVTDAKDDSLPDQTDNAGKFLTTDGENVSWGNAVVNTATKSNQLNITTLDGAAITPDRGGTSINIGENIYGGKYNDRGGIRIGKNINTREYEHSSGVFLSYKGIAYAGGGVIINGGISNFDGNDSNYAGGIIISGEGNLKITSKGVFSTLIGGVSIGETFTLQANYTTAIVNGFNGGKVSEDNTFWWGNQNGLYKLFDTDGTIPTDRYTITPTTAGTYVPKLTIAEDGTATREWGTESSSGDGNYLPLSGGNMTGDIDWGTVKIGGGSAPELVLKTRERDIKVFGFNVGGAYIYSPLSNLATLGVSHYKWNNVYTTKLNNGADIAIPENTGGTMVVATPPTDNGTYVLKATVVDGVVTTEWVLEA